jgi:hypothetical protein
MFQISKKIISSINRYKSYREYIEWYNTVGDDTYISEYSSHGIKLLRTLVELKYESPRLFTLVCMYDKLNFLK